jgi:lipopolysaccharide/colanic/teichoic acid biosynthesis glycosyltransferase
VKDSYGISKDQDDALKFEEQLIENSSDRTWPLYKIKNDPRKTKIGAFIEKWSIDELPQLMNVIKWEMSLVWPRPHQPREVEKYDFRENRVLTIKPWITGMAQVNWREKNTFEDEVRLDIFYIENWSLLLDLKIILKTISVVFRRGFKK